MRIDCIIIDNELTSSTYLKKCILEKFPEISIHGQASNYFEANRLIKSVHPLLIFYYSGTIHDNLLCALREKTQNHFETVFISDYAKDAIDAIRQDACGFLLKPFNVSDIVSSVGQAIQRVAEKTSLRCVHSQEHLAQSHSNLIGIPNIDGIEFLKASEIVRCEGLQKCTRIITIRNINMISSYSIGEFRKLLDENGFFSCHKSHLINLTHVRKLTRDGFIYLTDNFPVPLARRKRLEFLGNLKHL